MESLKQMQSKEVWCHNIEEESQRREKERITFIFKIQQNHCVVGSGEYK